MGNFIENIKRSSSQVSEIESAFNNLSKPLKDFLNPLFMGIIELKRRAIVYVPLKKTAKMNEEEQIMFSII